MERWRAAAVLLALALSGAASACIPAPAGSGPPPPTAAVVPEPVSLRLEGAGFTLGGSTRIVTPADAPDPARIGTVLAGVLRPSTGYPLPVSPGGGAACRQAICLSIQADAQLG